MVKQIKKFGILCAGAAALLIASGGCSHKREAAKPTIQRNDAEILRDHKPGMFEKSVRVVQ